MDETARNNYTQQETEPSWLSVWQHKNLNLTVVNLFVWLFYLQSVVNSGSPLRRTHGINTKAINFKLLIWCKLWMGVKVSRGEEFSALFLHTFYQLATILRTNVKQLFIWPKPFNHCPAIISGLYIHKGLRFYFSYLFQNLKKRQFYTKPEYMWPVKVSVPYNSNSYLNLTP